MKRHLVVLVVLCIVLGTSVCSLASDENLPVKGTKQLMFGFSGWGLSSYKGGVGLRYYLREKTALRFGLDVNWTKDDDAGWRHEVYEYDDPRLRTDTLDRSAISVGLGTILERHFRSSWNVVPYGGLGVFWWYDKSKSDEAVSEVSRDYTNNYAYESKGHMVEGLLLAGLQWHFAPNMSLAGEYVMSLKYSYKEYETSRSREEGGSIDYDSTDYDARKSYDLTVDASRLWLLISF